MSAQTNFKTVRPYRGSPRRWEKRKRTKRLTPRGRGAEPFHGSTAQCRQSLSFQVPWMGLERQAGSPAIMPPPPVTPKPGAGGFVHGPLLRRIPVGATTPTANKRVCRPAPKTLGATDRHQAESFQGLANQWQGGTCHRKFRADEWRLPRVSPRRLPQRNRKDLDRAHKCTGTQVRRAKIPAVKSGHRTSLQLQPTGRSCKR